MGNEKIGYALLYIYLLVGQVFALKFFIELCREWDNMVAIIFAGPFVAEFKGLLWIFFL